MPWGKANHNVGAPTRERAFENKPLGKRTKRNVELLRLWYDYVADIVAHCHNVLLREKRAASVDDFEIALAN